MRINLQMPYTNRNREQQKTTTGRCPTHNCACVRKFCNTAAPSLPPSYGRASQLPPPPNNNNVYIYTHIFILQVPTLNPLDDGELGDYSRVFEEQHKTLFAMGFTDEARNVHVLSKYDGRIDAALQELVQGGNR